MDGKKEDSARRSPEKETAANYLVNFYKQIIGVTELYAQYVNFMLEIKSKYEDTTKVSEEETAIIKQAITNLRFYLIQAYISYKSVSQSLNVPQDKTIDELYFKFTNDYMLERGDIEKFVIALNLFLVSDIIKNLLDVSKELVETAFK